MRVHAKLARLSTSLRIKDKAECGKDTKLLEGGDTAHKKCIQGGEGGHHTYFLNRATVGGTPHIKILSYILHGVGTPHKFSNISCWLGGWNMIRIMPLRL